MAKELEEGELEDGELPEDEPLLNAANDASLQLHAEALPSEDAGKAASSLATPADSDHVSAPSDAAVSVAPHSYSGSLHGYPLLDAPLPTYGSGMVSSAYNSPYASAPLNGVIGGRDSYHRTDDYASTSYSSPRSLNAYGNGQFDPRQMAYRDRFPSRHESRNYDDRSNGRSRNVRHSPSQNGSSSDEGELHSPSRHSKKDTRRTRDTQTIIDSLKAGTADTKIGVVAAKKSLESVSLDLRVALEDLEDLQEALSTKDLPATADNNSQLSANASKFFKGMRSIHLVCNTGAAKTAKLEVAGKLVRTIITQQQTLLTASLQKELEGWLKSSKVFKALADGEEETIQPKRVVPEAKARSPYVPKPPQKQQQKQPQPQGQKRQGKQQGSQSGPKGKKQRIAEQNQSEETSIDGEAEQPPLPSPLDELLIAQQSAGASQDSDIPPPPLPPLQNGHTADSQQPEAMQASDTHSLLGPPLSSASPSIQDSDAPVSFQPRAQVGFKLAGNKRQKLKLEPEEEADPSKSATHAAMRYRLEQAVAKQGAEQQQSKQALSDRSQQASAAQQAAADVPGLADAHADLYSNGQHEALDSHNAVSTSQQKYSWHNSQSQSGMTSQLPPGLQSPDQLPQQLPQQHDLPPGMASGAQQLQEQLPEQLLHQLPGQLPQETSGGGHRRRNRRGRRGAGKAPHTEVLLAGQTGPVGASDSQHSSDFIPSPASTMETSDQAYGVEPVGLASEDMPTQLQQHMYSHEVPHAQQRPHHQQPASMPDPVEDRVQSSRHRFDPSNSPGLADLAESGGAVAIATSSPMGSAEPAEQLQVLADDVKSLLRQGKLCLVLDLDHTLINSARFTEVEPEHEALLRHHMAGEANRLTEDRQIFRIERIQMWTKLRPAVRQFLYAASQQFELWIHTNGNKSYANAIVDLLDPDHQLFGQRIISQGAAGDGAQQDLTKRLMQGLEGRESIALVIDDTSSVWENHEENLFAVERYIYFPASRRQFNAKNRSMLEAKRDETPTTGMLMTALSVLQRTHKRFFRALNAAGGVDRAGYQLGGVRPTWDVRQMLREERQQVLAGVHIMFSRIIPLQEDPERHPFWRKAVKFGATCTTVPSEAVTHVIAYVNGTEKVYWAQRYHKHIVTPDWLNCTAALWKRAPEQAYPVTASA